MADRNREVADRQRRSPLSSGAGWGRESGPIARQDQEPPEPTFTVPVPTRDLVAMVGRVIAGLVVGWCFAWLVTAGGWDAARGPGWKLYVGISQAVLTPGERPWLAQVLFGIIPLPALFAATVVVIVVHAWRRARSYRDMTWAFAFSVSAYAIWLVAGLIESAIGGRA